MPRESRQHKQERLQLIVQRLREAYPQAHCELNYSNPLELLVATILSAQCTDKMVNRVTPELFKTCPDAAAYVAVPLSQLETIIRPLGFFRNKARHIQACARELQQRYRGVVPQNIEELCRLPGVGRKTANVVLGNAFGVQQGIVVDTHVRRLSLRLGLTTAEDPEKIEQDLMPFVSREDWALFSHLLIWHGRRRCFARNPDCPNCEVLDQCPTGSRRMGTATNPVTQ